MRIVGGRNRGRKLATPAGGGIRPTADRVREAVFNILAHGAPGGGSRITGARVLDGFAGTGAMGLEALSRGAAQASFIDRDPGPCRRNVAALDETARADIIAGDCLSPPPAAAPCGLVFLDPPYDKGLAVPALEALATAGWIADGAVCVVELAAGETLEPPSGFAVADERRYGAARVVLLDYAQPTA